MVVSKKDTLNIVLHKIFYYKNIDSIVFELIPLPYINLQWEANLFLLLALIYANPRWQEIPPDNSWFC